MISDLWMEHLDEFLRLMWIQQYSQSTIRQCKITAEQLTLLIFSFNVQFQFPQISIAFSAVLAYTISNEISDFIWAGRKTQVHPGRGSSPPFL